MPTIQDLIDFKDAAEQYAIDVKNWVEENIERLEKNQGIGSNPPTPPPNPPGT